MMTIADDQGTGVFGMRVELPSVSTKLLFQERKIKTWRSAE
jgi:hypothetical protein